MELRTFAEQVLFSSDLGSKIHRITVSLTDEQPGEARRVKTPARPENLQFAARRTAPAMPKAQALREERKRAVAHHVMANHELQALEVMAMVLLAFPEAPKEFRMGLAKIMFDEQRHTRMHAQRCSEMGLQFGDLPVNSWIWQKAQEYQSTLEYVASLPLVFEGANLDHTVEFERYFLDVGDRRSAAIMRAIHKDEIHHVQFGLDWLRQFKSPEDSDWDAWTKALKWPVRPVKARGDLFQREARLQAGLSAEFVDRLENCEDDTHIPASPDSEKKSR